MRQALAYSAEKEKLQFGPWKCCWIPLDGVLTVFFMSGRRRPKRWTKRRCGSLNGDLH